MVDHPLALSVRKKVDLVSNCGFMRLKVRGGRRTVSQGKDEVKDFSRL